MFRKLGLEENLALNLNHYSWALIAAWLDYEKGTAVSKEALELNKKLNNKRGVSVSLCNHAVADYWRGDLRSSKRRYEEALKLRQECGDQRGVSYLSIRLARVEFSLGNYDRSLDLLDLAIEILQEINDIQLISLHYTFKGLICYYLDDSGKAHEFLNIAYKGWSDIGRKWGMSLSSELLGLVLISMDKSDESRKYINHAEELRNSMTGCRQYNSLTDYCNAEWELYSGNIEAAKILHSKSLETRVELNLKTVICESLEAIAALFFIQEDYRKSILFLSGACFLRDEIEAPLPPRFYKKYKSIRLSCKKRLEAGEFQRIWDEAKAMELGQFSNLI
ncbi:tetratricopeptide repeat protein [Balneolaceae bacterium YR4-1]|uniref:Tetratricopeptide repeat protein n=1 Tax=Halalkalibaculum roseum TaxID=2709311 RepID=A0A6M1STK4_9BACT|nr:tetratricopeptide repeat protein [Halalkalibaculum roseum]NGP75476.1 tetratricopeptide repeat protein [Halalkalibaculum roseum]